MVLPIGEKINFDITSGDVLHGFYLPSLGVQRYAIPGTIVTSWTVIPKAGTYYGQCNQICGADHDAMPIEIKAVPMADYLAWVKVAQANYTENTVPASPLSSPLPHNQLADAAPGAASPRLRSPNMSSTTHDHRRSPTVMTRMATPSPSFVRRWLMSTNHKDIGTLYITMAVIGACVGGVLSMIMRSQLMYPHNTIDHQRQ